MVLLLDGNFEEGRKEYEWRRQTRKWSVPEFDAPRWKGEDITGKTLLLVAEQGAGDTIQFIRYASRVRSRCGRAVVFCPPPVAELLRSVPGTDLVVTKHEEQ